MRTFLFFPLPLQRHRELLRSLNLATRFDPLAFLRAMGPTSLYYIIFLIISFTLASPLTHRPDEQTASVQGYRAKLATLAVTASRRSYTFSRLDEGWVQYIADCTQRLTTSRFEPVEFTDDEVSTLTSLDEEEKLTLLDYLVDSLGVSSPR